MNNARPNVLQLIGNTPLIELTKFDTGPCRLFVKLESQNPGGSIKDRIAISMIDAAEREGHLKVGVPGKDTIIEATAGNTGLGLAMIGKLKGYKVILVVPDKMTREKVFHCKAMGADVRLARSDVMKGHPEYYQEVAARIAKETGGFFVNQFSNPANSFAHETTTGPEIWEQMEHDVDAVVCGVGSGGTMTGLANFFKRKNPNIEMILADPVGSILAPLVNEGKEVEVGSWLVEGIGEDFIPDILDMSVIKSAYAISDEDSISNARALLQREGVLAGSSSGTLLGAALRYCQAQTEPKRVVTLVCDRGDKYLSKTYSDFWVAEQGMSVPNPTGTVEDLVVRRHDQGDTVFVRESDTVKTAYQRMRVADVSQLPVLGDHAKLCGVLDEKHMMELLLASPEGEMLNKPVGEAMQSAVPLDKGTSIADAARFVQDKTAAMIVDGDRFLGVVTRVDMLNHFYLKGTMS